VAEKPKPKRKFVRWIVIVAIVVVAVGGWFVWTTIRNNTTNIESNKYQAVFFTNGQVYFGKLHQVNDNYMKLTDVYYLQSKDSSKDGDSTDSKNPQSSSDNSSVQLIKLGSEIHGPEDAMIISKDQVPFYENLKADGKVSQTIKQSKSGDNF